MFLGPSHVFGPSKIAFGHSGVGGSTAFADTDRGLGVSILINKMNFDYTDDPIAEICDTIRKYI